MLFRATVGSIAALLISSSVLAAYKITGYHITGAGSTNPTFVYDKWAGGFKSQTGISVNFQHIGSGKGVMQLRSKLVDFAATDAPLASKKLNRLGLVQFPTVIAPVVPVVNIRGIGVGELKLTGAVLADLFLGKIKLWNDPAIQQLNPDLKLPRQPVFIVHRSDDSGSTLNFTDYLSQVSEEWKEQVGSGKVVDWPKDAQTLHSKGNNGMAKFLLRTPGAIGYVSYAHAFANDLFYIQLQNRDGNFITPTPETFKVAVADADWASAPNYYLLLNNRPGANSWPINSVTYVVMHKTQYDVESARKTLKFFDWSFEHGDQLALDLHYVPMPDTVVELIRSTWTQISGPEGESIYPFK